MVRIILNDEEELVNDTCTVSDVLKDRKHKNVVVWINGRKLLKVEYDKYIVNEGDKIKIVQILGGG
jgi:thiamine biosynthesis protein ThiS